ARPQRLRQDHDPAADQPPGGGDVRAGAGPRTGRARAAARTAAPLDRLRHPGGRAVPAPERLRERGDGAAAAGLAGRAGAGARRGGAGGRVRARVGEVLEMVGLREGRFGGRMPAELSGGQRQRVGVARALAADPDLLLMDEPFGALDPGTREALQDEFLRLQARLRKAVVIVTHDIAEAGKLADEIVLMDHGRIVQQGPLRDLLIHPAGERVRPFFGGRGAALILEALRLRHLLADVPTSPASPNPIRLDREMPWGRVLASLADVRDGDTVQINSDTD